MRRSPHAPRPGASYLSFLSKKKRPSTPPPQPSAAASSTATLSAQTTAPQLVLSTLTGSAAATSGPQCASGPREGDQILGPTRHLGLVSGDSPGRPLSRSRRGSFSSPCLPTLSAAEPHPSPATTSPTRTAATQRRDRVLATKKSAKALLSRAVGFGHQTASATPPRTTADTDSSIPHEDNRVIKKPGMGSYMANEVLSLIFGNLMDRKSILNCSLVSRHWRGPAEAELVRITQDMPFNGQGLVHAIRTRFATDSFPCISMSIFDKLVCNLSELYYHSNPETKQAFAPEHPPDMLYHLFWTFLFIDQEFRNPRTRPKVTCNYFVRLLQNEGGGYPRQYFDKKVLKNIYQDIRLRPLLPAPHLIRALQEVDTSGVAADEGAASNQQEGATGPAPRQRRSSSFLNLAHSIKLEDSFKRLRRWWDSSREEGGRNQVGWVSHLDSTSLSSSAAAETSPLSTTDDPLQDPSSSADPLSESAASSSTSANPPPRQLIHSSSSTFPASSVPAAAATSWSSQTRTLRSRFGTKSDLAMNKRAEEASRGAGIGGSGKSNSIGSISASSVLHVTAPIMVMDQGFTAVAHGWHPEGDGLDNVVRFPKPKRPSSLGSQYHILQCSELMLEMDLEMDLES